jgi:hypothetical protein
MAVQQTLADLIYGGSDSAADDAVGAWTLFQRVPKGPG